MEIALTNVRSIRRDRPKMTGGRRFEVAEGLKAGDRVAAAVSGELHDGDRDRNRRRRG